MSDLLLDTCALLWLSQGGGELSKDCLQRIDEASFVYVSAISAWETSLLVMKKQVVLPSRPDVWFRAFTQAQNLHVLEIDTSVAFAAHTLPWHHRDPADRFILATALLNRLTIVTRDSRFADYEIPLLS